MAPTNNVVRLVRPAPKPLLREPARAPPLRVLVIDDSADDRMVVRFALGAEGFALTEAATGDAGLALAQAMHPDCVLLDSRLPDYDGIEVLHRLRQDSGALACAVVVLTRTGNAQQATALLKAGAMDYLTKELIDEDRLQRTVRGAAERFALLKEKRRNEERNAQLAAIVAASTDAIISVGLDDRVRTWNPGAGALFGYGEDEAVGRSIEELIVPEPLREERRRLYEDVKAGKAALALTSERRRRDGSIVPVDINVFPMFDAAGEVTGYSVIIRDITERKQSESRLLSIAGALSNAETSEGSEQLGEALPETERLFPKGVSAAVRLEAVKAACLLGTPLDRVFDQVTKLASGVLLAPVSIATVIDDERQCFIAEHGLAEPLAFERRSSAVQSYCRFVIESEAPVIIRNASENPLVAAIGAWREGFVSYLGVPVRNEKGLTIASLGVADFEPRTWTRQELLMLQGIAALLMRELENRSHLREIRYSEAFSRSILEASPDCTKVVSTTGDLEFINVNGLGIMEVDDFGPLQGRKWSSLWPEAMRERVDAAVAAASAGRTDRFEGYCPTAKGTPKWWDVMVVPFERDGRVTRLIATSRDITERRRYEEALRESENRLAAILGQTTAGIAALDRDGRFTLVNDRSCQITGYSREELMRLRMMDLTHPDDLPRNMELFRTLLQSGQSFEFEKRYLHKDGRVVWVNSSVAAVRDGNGRITAVVAACIDITERRRYEEALRESEGQLRAIYDGGTTYIGWLAPDGTLVRANRASLEFAGSALEDVLGRPFWETVWFQYTAGAPELMRETLARVATGEPVRRELTLVRPTGEPRTFDFSLHPVRDEGGKLLGFVPEGRDITERKRAEEALRESEQRLMLALHASATGVWDWDLKSDRVSWSGHIYPIFGVSAFGGTREDFARFVHPDDASGLWASIEEALRTRAPFEAEFRIVRPDGEVRWVSNHASAEYDAAGRPVRLLGTVSDITERRHTEDVLRASGALLQGVTDRARVGLFLVDEDERLRFGNPAWLEMMGLPVDTDIIGRHLRDVIRDERFEALAPELAKARAGETVKFEESGAAEHAVAPAAECREVHLQPVADATGRIRDVLAVVVDISERTRKEKQIKLLMGEVNHRSKNLLSVVQSVARHIARTGDPADFVARFSQRIMSLAASHDLLVTSQWTGVDLRALAEAQLEHFKDLIGTRVLIEGPPARLGSAAAQGIGMALHELATNAGKYGSLSGSRGTVRLSWNVQPQAGQGAMVTLRWEEEGGPEVRPPPQSGFGQLVIGPMAEAAVDGKAVTDYRLSGLVWILEFPTDGALEPAY